MISLRCTLAILALELGGVCARAEQSSPPTDSSPSVSVYAPDFFAASRTQSAFEMLALLPGYQFIETEIERRGLASASGNVLIDGRRPASKYESLESILRRIPARSVARIELVRAGTAGIDMQGHSVLANVVRARDAALQGSAEIGEAFYERGFHAPRIAVELTHNQAQRTIEFSGALYRTVDDEHGTGSRTRVTPSGELLRDAKYTQDEGEQIGEAAIDYEDGGFGGKLRLHLASRQTRFRADILDEVFHPQQRTTIVREFEKENSNEAGANFERALSAAWKLEIAGVHRTLQTQGGERAFEEPDRYLFREEADASESIVRTTLTRKRTATSFETGMEITRNVFDSRSRLSENDVEIAIPSDEASIEERRNEAFANLSWIVDAHWNVELGARFEQSELAQHGENTSTKSFSFLKPRLQLRWSPDANQFQVLVERLVGQLDFEDFASTASLSTGTVTAGNPRLEPDRTWRAEIAWERALLTTGGIRIAVRHDAIDALVDRVPVVAETTFDAIGNIGSGVRNELEINLTLPLDSLGMPAALVKAQALVRRSQARDPVTGTRRSISEEAPLEGELLLLQPLPELKSRWGLELKLREQEREYRFDEIRTDRVGTMLNAFLEYVPAQRWKVRLFANNLSDRSTERRRQTFGGARSTASVNYVETRVLNVGRYFGLRVQRSFGG